MWFNLSVAFRWVEKLSSSFPQPTNISWVLHVLVLSTLAKRRKHKCEQQVCPCAPVKCTIQQSTQTFSEKLLQRVWCHLGDQQGAVRFHIWASSLVSGEPRKSQAQDFIFFTNLSQDWFLHCNKLKTPVMYVQFAMARIYCLGNGVWQNMLVKLTWILKPDRIVSKANGSCLIRFLSSHRFVFFKI